MKKRWLFIFTIFVPVVLLAGSDAQTDIVPRTVNFLIFIAILYYLLADQLRAFFSERTKSIQNQLDEVQKKLDESKKKMEVARVEFENAKTIANDLVKDSISETSAIKHKVSKMYESEIALLTKNFNAKLELEMRKAKKEITIEVLNELLSDDNMAITQDNLENIVLKKVA